MDSTKLRVQTRARVGDFLLACEEVRIQRWRIPILIRCGGIKIRHSGNDILIDAEASDQEILSIEVERNDEVIIITEQTERCAQDIRAVEASHFRDYAFVSDFGTGPFLDLAREAFALRPGTIMGTEAQHTKSIAWMVSRAHEPWFVTSPISRFILAVHSSGAEWHIKSDESATGERVAYEDLLAANESGNLKVAIDDWRPEPQPDNASPLPRLVILGCHGAGLVQDWTGFVRAFRDAIGGDLPVSVSKHSVVLKRDEASKGVLLFFEYCLRYFSPRIATLEGVLGRWLDSKDIWGDGFGLEKMRVWTDRLREADMSHITPDEGKRVGGIEVTRLWAEGNEVLQTTFRHRRTDYFGERRFFECEADPEDQQACKRAVKAVLLEHPLFQSAYPEWIRFGNSDLDSFIDSWDWDFRAARGGVTCRPTRHAYFLDVPIVWPDRRNELCCNFFYDDTSVPPFANFDFGEESLFLVMTPWST